MTTQGSYYDHTVIKKMASNASVNKVEYKFLTEPPDDLKCLICLGVARDPLQHGKCGKLFCEDCLEKYGRHKPCPNCRTRDSNYFVDKRSKYVLILHVLCLCSKFLHGFRLSISL